MSRPSSQVATQAQQDRVRLEAMTLNAEEETEIERYRNTIDDFRPGNTVGFNIRQYQDDEDQLVHHRDSLTGVRNRAVEAGRTGFATALQELIDEAQGLYDESNEPEELDTPDAGDDTTVDDLLEQFRVEDAQPERTEAEQRDAEFRADPSRFEGVPPPNQQGRGELQPSLVARAAQNLRENPLAAQMYDQRLLGASQTADTAAMARVNHEVYAQQARDGVRGIRRRQRPNGKVDWSKRRIARPSKA